MLCSCQDVVCCWCTLVRALCCLIQHMTCGLLLKMLRSCWDVVCCWCTLGRALCCLIWHMTCGLLLKMVRICWDMVCCWCKTNKNNNNVRFHCCCSDSNITVGFGIHASLHWDKRCVLIWALKLTFILFPWYQNLWRNSNPHLLANERTLNDCD